MTPQVKSYTFNSGLALLRIRFLRWLGVEIADETVKLSLPAGAALAAVRHRETAVKSCAIVRDALAQRQLLLRKGSCQRKLTEGSFFS